MTKRTVLHLIHTGGAGGAETVVCQLIERLDPATWHSVAGVPAAEGWLWSALQDTHADVAVIPNSGPFDLGMLRRLVSLARARGVDLIHTHLFGPALYGGIAARVLGLPIVSTIHGTVDLSSAQRWGGMKKHLLRRPDHCFVGVTEMIRRQVVEELGVPAARTHLIANGIDVSRFAPARSRRLRAELGWDGDEIIVGALGNVRHPKGYDGLLEVAHRLRGRCERLRFIIVGDVDGEPELYSSLIERRRALGLEDRVVFTGFRKDVPDALNNFDIFVLSSVREGLPLAVLQAMAARLPIVATLSGGPQEVLTDGHDALLVPVQDPDALARGIERLVNDPAERDRLAGAGYRAVHERHTVERMAGAYARLYAERLEGAASRRSSESVLH